jgi:hypothetical protein
MQAMLGFITRAGWTILRPAPQDRKPADPPETRVKTLSPTNLEEVPGNYITFAAVKMLVSSRRFFLIFFR